MNEIDLSRFVITHKNQYADALNEIRNGEKRTHWMWYIFPQIHSLGSSSTAEFYAIKNLNEAKAFLEDSYLGKNLREISEALLSQQTNDVNQIFDYPDNLKLHSSMTLFSLVAEENSVFHKVLDKFFDSKLDQNTLNILNEDNK